MFALVPNRCRFFGFFIATCLYVVAEEPLVEDASCLLTRVSAQSTEQIRETFRYGSAGSHWGDALTRWTPSGRSYVGSEKSGETLKFEKDGLAQHQAVLVRAKCFIIYHWDGNWTVYGPDLFRVQLDQHRELLRTSFSNYDAVGQSYPDAWPWGVHRARTGAAETGTLGWKFPGGWGQPLDAVYDMWFGAAHDGSTLSLEFRGDFHDAGDPQYLRGEQWGIESLEVYTFASAVELPDITWETLANHLLSEDPVKFADARALLPLGEKERVVGALDAAATRHGLDRERLGNKNRDDQNDTAILANVLERAVDELRRRDDNLQPTVPPKAARAARIYQALTLMNADRPWQLLLWNEMNRKH